MSAGTTTIEDKIAISQLTYGGGDGVLYFTPAGDCRTAPRNSCVVRFGVERGTFTDQPGVNRIFCHFVYSSAKFVCAEFYSQFRVPDFVLYRWEAEGLGEPLIQLERDLRVFQHSDESLVLRHDPANYALLAAELNVFQLQKQLHSITTQLVGFVAEYAELGVTIAELEKRQLEVKEQLLTATLAHR